MKRLLLASFFAVLVLASVINLTVFPRSIVANNGGAEFAVGKFIEINQFDESAPAVLTNHFRRVSVKRIGDPKKTGINFSNELVRIFGVRDITRLPPLDIRGMGYWQRLSPYVQYSSRAGCAVNREERVCQLMLVWDAKNSSPFRTFVTFRIGDTAFAMVDSNLVVNLLGVTQW